MQIQALPAADIVIGFCCDGCPVHWFVFYINDKRAAHALYLPPSTTNVHICVIKSWHGL